MSEQRLFELDARASTDDLLSESYEHVERLKAEHKPSRTALLFSGGNDSLVLLDTMVRHADEIVTIDTGIGIPESLAFARRTAKRYGIPHTVLSPATTTLANGRRNDTYEEKVLGTGLAPNPWRGMPGPGMHSGTYRALKERPLEHWLRHHRRFRGERFMLLTGARKYESVRRMGTSELVKRKGGQVWVNPLNWWRNANMSEYRQGESLPENEVATHLHMSGECLCGAMADQKDKREERAEIRFFYPEWERAKLVPLERECVARGLPFVEWGVKRAGAKPDKGGEMCSSCNLRLFDLPESPVAIAAAGAADGETT